MALLELVLLPDPRLRQKSAKIEKFGPELKKLVDDMVETMHWAKGIGLAAIQVGIPQRLLIIDLGDLDENDEFIEGDAESEKRLADRRKESKLEVFINPEILSSSGEIEYEEGCLSVPGVFSNVKRKGKIQLRYQDLAGKTHEIEATGLRAIVLQHEMDHLEGVVFTDRLGPMQRMMVMTKYNKLQKDKKKEPEFA